MAILTNNLEGGTSGTAVTFVNSGGVSGNAFTVVTNDVTYDSAQKAHGTLSAKILPTAPANTWVAWDVAETNLVARAYIRMTAYPVGGTTVLQLSAASGGVSVIILTDTNEGRVQLYCGGSQGTSPAGTLFPLNTWVRVEVYAKSGVGTGALRMAFYSNDSVTPLYDTGLLSSKTVANGGNFTRIAAGKNDSLTDTNARWVDDFGVKTDADATWNPWPGTVSPPAVTAGPTQTVASGGQATLAFTASTADGTIVNRTTTFDYPTSGAPTITDGNTNSPKFTTGAAGSIYIVRHSATNSGGLTSHAITEIRVPASASSAARPLPMAGSGVGSWTIGGSSSTEGAALADETDSTYVQSPSLSDIASTRKWRLAPLTARTELTLKQRLWTINGGGATVKVRLYVGTAAFQEWTQAVTTTPTEYNFLVTSPNLITDWGGLYIEVEATA